MMKWLLIVGCTIGLVASSFGVPEDVQQQFQEWMKEQGRLYRTVDEENKRMVHFYSNLLKVAALNQAEAHHKHGAVFKLNKFADWSEAELRRLRGFRGNSVDLKGTIQANVTARMDIPSSFDWRPKGVLADIQDQGQCGSCWAFSTTSNVESVNAIKSGKLQKLSEQFLVDCDKTCGTYRFENGCDAGCNGGLQPSAFKYIMQNGQPSEDSYPYQASDGTCQHNHKAVSKIKNWEFVAQDEQAMATYVATKGPLSVAVDASSWSFYTGGIMTSSSICAPITDPASALDHAVNVVGYGEEDGTKYWIIRNSWADTWGEDGYCRILRGTGFCGVDLFACSAVV